MEPVMKTEQKEVQDWAVQNDNKPLWTRSPREVHPHSLDVTFACPYHVSSQVPAEPLRSAHLAVLPVLSAHLNVINGPFSPRGIADRHIISTPQVLDEPVQ